MDIDPHTLQRILDRIEKQMRCPQCGRQVPVDFSSVRLMAENAMLLQVKCDDCNAYIVLQASLQGMEHVDSKPFDIDETANVSTTLKLGKNEMDALKDSIQESGGSFTKLFKEVKIEQEDLPLED
ncbi:hypothetical protein HN512_03485 [Candidatus Peregrinibacteria bacterium]|jgi:transcription elongation factor Elf1|nr:hypothetical protein [Candidatus Peregrinibacteria bacterium]MBT3598875.1 hypothetical protein [Candidatus Peregrinibacteria bacterium]MBT6730828.1 hypothetical protein [Candidatus Peregrinibacteria bacterium]MBT7009621.1 hypothetical protein [Candidatus Peregrinibacteria bacterium]MBT7344464.1 hypothetical protein [Candidatus Peregrinibacteria bacterium]